MNAVNNLITTSLTRRQIASVNVPLNYSRKCHPIFHSDSLTHLIQFLNSSKSTHFRLLFSPPIMASPGSVKLSYKRLKQEVSFEDEGYDFGLREKVLERYLRGSVHHRFFRRVHVRRRLRVKIPSLRRFLSRKARVLKTAWLKTCKRLKESQAHFGDIFAGNYMFMQVTPTPLKSSVDYRNRSFVYQKDQISVDGFSSTKYSLAA